ncbi:hypothetical protein [Flavobacterium daejeonense]|uniref:hypothetical protein n=1 Tax=Flavobacterium daejeonense TaxID=350893 RepID=UPI00047AAA24|nr:hypothetical protein [Flavobacterium daejeonense]
MEDAVMLFDGQVVPLSAISDSGIFNPKDPNLLFFNDISEVDIKGNSINRDGRVRRFKKGDTAYMAAFDAKTGDFNGYYSEEKFWENNYISNDKKGTEATKLDLGKKFSFTPFFSYDDTMKVYFEYKFITIDADQKIKLIYNYQYALFSEISSNSNLNNLPLHASGDNNLQVISEPVSDDLNYYGNYIINKKFLLPNNTLSSLDNGQKGIIFEIIYVWNEIFSDANFIIWLIDNKLYAPLEAHINLPNRYNLPYGTIESAYHQLYTEEYFARLRLALIDFRYWILNYKEDYSKIAIEEFAVYIINLFPVEELSYLDYDVKINLLKKILNPDNKWIIGNWFFNTLNEEQALIKLIRSIAHESNGELNYDEIDKFLIYLNTIYDYSVKETLYEVLYSKINDGTVYDDDGNGNQGQFVKAVYNLWLESKFNPFHEIPAKAQTALDNFIYTPFNCRWKVFDPDISFFDKIPDYTAAPLVINYESDKKLLWYVDNYKFEFYENKILAKEEVKDYGYQPYGVYNFFQPLSIKPSDVNETIINLPLLNLLNKETPVEGELYNCIPAFYLKYVDDLGDKSDVKNTISTIFDVVLTFTGIGNLPKLRHLKDLSLFGRLLRPGSAALSASETAHLIRAFKGLFNTFEAVSGVASMAHSLLASSTCDVYFNSQGQPPSESDPEYQSYQECLEFKDNIDLWLGAVEIFSMSADIITSRMLKKATKKLRNSIPPHSSFDNFRTLVSQIDNLGDDLSGFLIRLENDFPNVKSIFNISAFNEEEKIAFMFEYGDNIPALTIIDRDAQKLMDNWKLLYNKKINDRNNLEFLANQARTTAIVRYYDASDDLRKTLEGIADSKRWDFLDQYGTTSSTIFDKFVENHNLVNYWKRFHYDNAIEGFKALTNSKQITFLEHYGDCSADVFNRIKKGNLIKYWEKVDNSPLHVSVHSTYIKKVGYLEAVGKAHVSRNHGELLVNHLKGTIKKDLHNGNNLVTGYSGLHFDFVITEPNPLTFITTTINGEVYKIGPPPTVSATVQSAIKAGSELPDSGAKDCEVYVWGYIRENIGNRRNPNMQFILDGSGNPIQGWVGKTNSSRTTLFVGISEEKALNEIAFARYNLNPNSWVRGMNGQSSAKWQGLSSEGVKIQMFLGNKVSIQPTTVPSSTLDYGSAFPTLLP